MKTQANTAKQSRAEGDKRYKQLKAAASLAGTTLGEIATEFGCSAQHLRNIARGIYWYDTPLTKNVNTRIDALIQKHLNTKS